MPAHVPSSSESAPDVADNVSGATATPKKRPGRVRDVTPRDVDRASDEMELFYAFLCGLDVLAELAEPEDPQNSELHGDLNPSAFVILDHCEPGEIPEDRYWDTAVTVGAIIYWEPPISIQTLRKMGNPDKPTPFRLAHADVCPTCRRPDLGGR